MSFKFEVTTTPAHLEIPDSAEAKANAIFLRQNLAQMKAKQNAKGAPLPAGVDLYETGALQRSGVYDANGYSFTVAYAEYLEGFDPFGVAPGNQASAETEIGYIWDSEPLEIEED